MDRETLGSIDTLLDEALYDVVTGTADTRTEQAARRRRIVGTSLMAIASACIGAVGLLAGRIGQAAMLLTCAAAIALLATGASLIDRAGKDELRRNVDNLADADRSSLGAALDVMTLALARRRRHFGISMLVLACFCICVFSAGLTSGGSFFTLMWGGFSILLVGVGAWQIERSANEAMRAQAMRDAALHRKAAKTGTHIRRVR
ncbi:hypothetical protein H5407_08815 [Mitsuaria sp. WAJ17]|uniref:hypothetical protein n=1 Tax=Mitsuaria sp. WAJ17 TaxID=2761452 RepID=UPI0016031CBF|nr:hypothetical protein [Mitsuaria sp. WAJ17]MBB2485328.1 hypothetical protein [Mitsuaria sp. WAJ17]